MSVDGDKLEARRGETVAAALIARGDAALRHTRRGYGRGLYCGMGVCFECLVMVDGLPNTRACMTWVRDGMDVRHMDGLVAAGSIEENG